VARTADGIDDVQVLLPRKGGEKHDPQHAEAGIPRRLEDRRRRFRS
jgi:hypothetical protein